MHQSLAGLGVAVCCRVYGFVPSEVMASGFECTFAGEGSTGVHQSLAGLGELFSVGFVALGLSTLLQGERSTGVHQSLAGLGELFSEGLWL